MRLAKTAIAIAIAFAAVGCGKGAPSPKPRADNTPTPTPTPVPAAADGGQREIVLAPAPPIPLAPRGLPDTPSPLDNPTTAEKVALGGILFFDPRLAANRSASCATCHDPAKGWADGVERNQPVAGKPNLRHTPSIYNVGYARSLYWDGRQNTLEDLLPGHWEGQLAGDPEAVATTLATIPEYRAHFQRTFSAPPSPDAVVAALAAFVRTVRSGDAPFDQYEVAGDPAAVSPEALAGFKVFSERAQCALCHTPPLYADSLYHGVGPGQTPDPGRALVTHRDNDVNAFRTPPLRSVSLTAPYFHDGSAPTLRDAVTRCLAAGHDSAPPVVLAAEEIDQLLAFLAALTPATAATATPTLPADAR